MRACTRRRMHEICSDCTLTHSTTLARLSRQRRPKRRPGRLTSFQDPQACSRFDLSGKLSNTLAETKQNIISCSGCASEGWLGRSCPPRAPGCSTRRSSAAAVCFFSPLPIYSSPNGSFATMRLRRRLLLSSFPAPSCFRAACLSSWSSKSSAA